MLTLSRLSKACQKIKPVLVRKLTKIHLKHNLDDVTLAFEDIKSFVAQKMGIHIKLSVDQDTKDSLPQSVLASLTSSFRDTLLVCRDGKIVVRVLQITVLRRLF